MAFDEQYLVADGPINSKTGEAYGKATKAYAEWLVSQKREIVCTKDYDFITNDYRRVEQSADAWIFCLIPSSTRFTQTEKNGGIWH